MIDYWQPADREGAISVVREVFEEYRFTWEPEDYHSDLYDVKHFYFDQGHIFLVAKRDDLVVGTVGVEFFERLPGNAGKMHLINGKESDRWS